MKSLGIFNHFSFENPKINPKRKTSANVNQSREVKAIIPAKAEGITKLNVKTNTPSLTPSPAGTKTANNPIKPAAAVVPVINR
jgi:hypothetical protein